MYNVSYFIFVRIIIYLKNKQKTKILLFETDRKKKINNINNNNNKRNGRSQNKTCTYDR